MKRIILINIIVTLFLSMTTIHGTNSWDLDSNDWLFLNETDYFYLSLIPENYEVVVGVLGSGIEPGLEYLDDFIYTNPNETLNGLDDDNNGVVDDISGASFVYNDDYDLIISNEMKDASGNNYGHETVVASIIASKPTEQNPSIFAPTYFSNSKIKLLPIRFTKNGNLYNALHASAVNYAVSMNVDIMTCSYGDRSISSSVDNAYQSAFDNNIIVVASAGNSGELLDTYPCMYDDSICVGGIESGLNFSSNSSYGHNDFVTFDTNINLLGKTGLPINNTNYFAVELIGTSFSAPQITATIAKILSFDDSYNKESVYSLLKKHAKFTGDNAGHGYINFKSLAEEFITIKTKFVSHPDNENLVYEFIWSEDKTSGVFARGFIRYMYLDGVRFSVFKEFQL